MTDTIEDRYNSMKITTCIVLLLTFLLCTSSILTQENKIIIDHYNVIKK